MKREELYENIDKQALHEKLYRYKVRERFRKYFNMKKEQYLAEKIIRRKIQRIIEAKKQVRYDNTGLNVLDDLFNDFAMGLASLWDDVGMKLASCGTTLA